MSTSKISKIRVIAAWVIAGLLTVLFIKSAIGKFTTPEMLGPALLPWANIIAVGEIISALVFLFPKTNVFGTALLSSYMGGAIMVHMSNGMPILFPSLILIVIWVVAALRYPETCLLKLK